MTKIVLIVEFQLRPAAVHHGPPALDALSCARLRRQPQLLQPVAQRGIVAIARQMSDLQSHGSGIKQVVAFDLTPERVVVAQELLDELVKTGLEDRLH